MGYGERFTEAMVYAASLHRDQVRKGSGVPYVTHLLVVAGTVGDAGGSEDEVIAALLHDGPEDQGGRETLREIERRFGSRVAGIVEGLTDTFETPKPAWRARKEAYLAHLPAASPSVLLVSIADKLHNARSIVADVREGGEAVWSRFRGGRDGTLWYYRSLLATFRLCPVPPRLLEALAAAVADLEAIAVDERRGAKG
jgi:GTP pyrophosphokinase